MRNLWLFLVLIGLTVFTYYFDELEQMKKNYQLQKKSQLFDFTKIGELKGIKTAKSEFFKVDRLYYTAQYNRLVDLEKMQRFMEILSKLRIKRILTSEEMNQKAREDYFPQKDENYFEFIFSGGRVVSRIGKKLEFDQSFYVEVERDGEKSWVVAFDSSADTGVYREGTLHRSDRKYQRLIRMTQLKEDFFYDRYVFKRRGNDKDQYWEQAEIKNKRNRSYEVNLTDNYITPSCPSGIATDSQMFETFSDLVLNLQGIHLYYPYRKELLKDWKGSIKLRDYDGNRHRLDLFGQYGSLKGHFLRANLNENLYELDEKTVQIFFINHQDYCNLRPPFYEISRLKKEVFFNMDFKKGFNFKLYIPLQERFEAKLLEEEEGIWNAHNKNFHDLFEFFSKKADMVTTPTNAISKLVDQASFSILYDNETFFVIFANKEIQLLSLKYKYLLHYLVGEGSPIASKMSEYFLKKRDEQEKM